MRSCAISGKKTKVGVSGRHRHSGAWAMKAPSSKKVWYPNLHTTAIKIDGVTKRIKVSTKALRQLKKAGASFSREQAKAMGLI
jgi:ribosomal protein L28